LTVSGASAFVIAYKTSSPVVRMSRDRASTVTVWVACWVNVYRASTEHWSTANPLCGTKDRTYCGTAWNLISTVQTVYTENLEE